MVLCQFAEVCSSFTFDILLSPLRPVLAVHHCFLSPDISVECAEILSISRSSALIHRVLEWGRSMKLPCTASVAVQKLLLTLTDFILSFQGQEASNWRPLCSLANLWCLHQHIQWIPKKAVFQKNHTRPLLSICVIASRGHHLLEQQPVHH